MKQNVILALFGSQPEAYQAFSELKAYRQTAETLLGQALLVKKQNGVLTPVESADFADNVGNKALTGGLIGGLLGILGGPFGVLLGGSLGALFGANIGTAETVGEAGLLYTAVEKLKDGDTAVIVLAEEAGDATLDAFFGQYDTTVVRADAEAVRESVAQRVKAELDDANIAKAEEKRQKAQERQAKLDEFKADAQAKWDELKAKFK